MSEIENYKKLLNLLIENCYENDKNKIVSTYNKLIDAYMEVVLNERLNS